MNKAIIFLSVSIIFSLVFSTVALAKDFELPSAGLAPDSPFYFVKFWKESIQTFFIFNAEQKAKQYLHLAGVRLAEYQKMVEKNILRQAQDKKLKIVEMTLNKYLNQLNRALAKAEELKNKGKDIKELKTKIERTTQKHLEVLRLNLERVPEQAKKGIENAIENSRKQIEKILERPIFIACPMDAKICSDGTSAGRTGPNCEFAPCPGESPAAGVPNPASVYCGEKQGKLEIRTDEKGNERGICIFADGNECEEWAFFRGECKKGEKFCKNLCGNGICQEIVCLAIGCPCSETKDSCPSDCN